MALWDEIKNKHEQNKQKIATSGNTDSTSLYNMLTDDKINTQTTAGDANLSESLGNIANAARTFGKAFGSNGSSGSVPSQYQFSNTNKPLWGNYSLGGANAGANTLGATNASNSGGFLSNLKGGGSGGGTPWALIGGLAKGGYNAISGKDDKDYSDTEESIIYPLQGAAMGSQFGPWGAAGGALYGLGYSFKDDLGLKDDNFLTNVLFPIGMGDGGGFIDLG